ncbi:hypothetical protein AJ80_08678 [Polytolypa hystricis UAMH7299]|uniref:chitin deacetylase n=1 Tax=Polytolypa hystricis (strain UAMH7299) TaxID=1447883 RepID=A0A2B7X3K1_POLH7|nr:hypothetical protein AJ80_08678 [Polytolypa hystricis UAMH7299]
MIALYIASCFLIVPLLFVYRPPAFVIRHFQKRWPDILWHVPTSKKLVALTIDDAPSKHTRDILEALRENNATATFFIIGSQVSPHEETLLDLIHNNHELANHAMHDEPSRSLSDSDLEAQIQAVQKIIRRAYTEAGTNMPPNYFRPGSGFFSNRMRKLLRELNFRLILGGIYPHDPQIPFWRINSWHILSLVRPGGIIICHDRRSWTAPMLRKVLPQLKRRGYQVVTITELLKLGQHTS